MPTNPALEGRNGQIWKLYCRGMNQEALAQRFDLSQVRISQIIAQVRDAIPVEDRAAIVKREIDFLDTVRAEVMELWDKGPNKAYAANGRELEGVEDHAGRLAALARAESLTARLHRVMGLDAPQKVDLNVTGEEEATRKAAADSLAHLHGGTDDA